jgi:hypothetical protein
MHSGTGNVSSIEKLSRSKGRIAPPAREEISGKDGIEM